MKDMSSLNKKVSSLENENVRLKLIGSQYQEVAAKSSEKEQQQPQQDQPLQKCSFEDRGSCKRKEECRFVHPVGTCQSFSKLGSCSSQYSCTMRHPQRTCHHFERYGSCQRGDDCRFRHPIEFSFNNFNNQRNPFLENTRSQYNNRRQGTYNRRKNHPQREDQQTAPQPNTAPHLQVLPENIQHHDRRGSRW